jgi:hypothetical protein
MPTLGWPHCQLKETTMGEHKDEQDKPLQGPGQNPPMTQPDKSEERADKDRKATDQDDPDQDEMKKHSPSPNNPNNPNR